MPETAAREVVRGRGRGFLVVGGVLVALLLVIVLVNLGGGDTTKDAGAKDGDAQPAGAAGAEAPSGQVPDVAAGVGTKFPQTEAGAQSAAANYAIAIGSEKMFSTEGRKDVLESVFVPEAAEKEKSKQEAAYSPKFLRSIGLDKDGKAPAGATFVSRTLPAGTTATQAKDGSVKVEVWCDSLFGLAGQDSKNPVTTRWFTVTMKLKWTSGAWRATSYEQESGPTPVAGDAPISGSKEIAEAVKRAGGFTYAR